MIPETLISIITPVYNGANYIEQTINSVLKADLSIPFEYIVIDDGSTDQTLGILESFKSTVQIFRQKNVGESATVNRGLEIASGKYVLVVNADDPLLTAELIYRAVAILEDDASIVAVYPDWKIIDESGETLKINLLPEYSDEVMIGHCKCIPGPGVVFRRDAALKIGGRRIKWKFVGDYDFWLRLRREGKIERLPGVLAQWRSSQASTSISQRGIRMANERVQVIEQYVLENTISSNLSRKALGNAYYIAARLAFFDPIIDGRKLLIKSFRSRRGWPEEVKVYVVVFLLLMPISARVMNLFPKLKSRIVESNTQRI